MSSKRIALSELPIIPPIISNDKDKDFLCKLSIFIQNELQKLDEDDEEQRFTVYKAAFDKIVDYVGAYKPLLAAIKAEYEDVIETIRKGQREAVYLSGKLKAVASGPSTLRNYRKRADELETNMSVICSDNEKLKEQIYALREAREAKEKEKEETPETQVRLINKDKRSVPEQIATSLMNSLQLKVQEASKSGRGLTLEQTTDPKTLTKELEKLDRQLKELNLAHRTRYVPKDVKLNLKEHLGAKVNLRDQLAEKTDILKYKGQKLKVAVEAARAYMKIQPPHQTVGDAVVNALHRANTQGVLHKDDGTASTAFEEDDPAKEKEAEIMLEYIEKFTELMEDQKYEEAAVHAANSPKGILRTVETMYRFKDIRTATDKGRSALLAFLEALIATVPSYDVIPSEQISLEAVRCALNENRLPLLAHWLTQNRLTLSEAIGDTIWQYATEKPKSAIQCLAWAQRVYDSLELHTQAIKCMVVRGKIKQALQYAYHSANYSVTDYAELLKKYPHEELARALAGRELDSKMMMHVTLVASVLQENGQEELSLKLLMDYCKQDPRTGTFNPVELRRELFENPCITPDQLLELSEMCGRYGYTEISLELLSASTVLKAVQGAMSLTQSHQNLEMEHQQAADTGRTGRTRLRFASDPDTDSLDESIYPDSMNSEQ